MPSVAADWLRSVEAEPSTRAGTPVNTVIDRPGTIDFDATTELIMRRVGRARPAFFFPNTDRKSTSIEFGLITASAHWGPFVQIPGAVRMGRGLPTSAF